MSAQYTTDQMDRVKSQIVFLLHANRSGSTFLSSMLDKTRYVGMSIEGGFFLRFFIEGTTLQNDNDIDKLINSFQSDPRFKDWESDTERARNSLRQLPKPANVEDVTRCIMSNYFSNQDVDYFIFKGSGGEHYVPLLRKLFSNSKFIHIVRDPRAVINSQLKTKSSIVNVPMANDPIIAAKRWSKMVNSFWNERGDDFLEVRYEDLMDDVGQAMKRICDFLNVPGLRAPEFDPEAGVGEYFNRIPEDQKNIHANVKTGVALKQRASAWQEELSETDIHLIQTTSRKEMERLGYEAMNISPTARAFPRVFFRILRTRLAAIINGIRRYSSYLANPYLLSEKLLLKFRSSKNR